MAGGLGSHVAVAVASVLLSLLYRSWTSDSLPHAERQELWEWLERYEAWNVSSKLKDNPLMQYYANYSGGAITTFPHFMEVYHRHAAKFQGQPIKILVLGLHESGGEIGAWQTYLGPSSEFIGADHNPRAMFLEDIYENTTVYTGDAGDAFFLQAIKKKEGPFHIIVDDASHFPVDQITAFQTLFSALHPGGVYMVEDLHMSRLTHDFRVLPWLIYNGATMGGIGFILPLIKILGYESFISYITSYGGEMLKKAGPFGSCFKHPRERGQEFMLEKECATVLSTHSIHIYTEMVVVEKRSEEFFQAEMKLGT